MRITKDFGGQNDRRYGKPWIAMVTNWPIGRGPHLKFGGFLGTISDGGQVEIEAEIGDILKFGQKDYRGGNTINAFGIAMIDGTVAEASAVEAREAWIDQYIELETGETK